MTLMIEKLERAKLHLRTKNAVGVSGLTRPFVVWCFKLHAKVFAVQIQISVVTKHITRPRLISLPCMWMFRRPARLPQRIALSCSGILTLRIQENVPPLAALKRSTRVRRKWQCRKRCNSWTKSSDSMKTLHCLCALRVCFGEFN